jgi:hypothetical protein
MPITGSAMVKLTPSMLAIFASNPYHRPEHANTQTTTEGQNQRESGKKDLNIGRN